MSNLASEWWKYFAADYDDSRQRFLAAAHKANAAIQTHQHPQASGPAGQPLFVDVARIGNVNADRVLFVLSGTHGLEAKAGAAAQTAWLDTLQQATIPESVAVVHVHAINPFGFAHLSRTTENNVDLNRNFLAHDGSYPSNEHYEKLYPHLVPKEWSGPARQEVTQALDDFAAQYGKDALFNVRAKGQYQFADGPGYGGRSREWSNLILEQIVTEHAAQASRAGLIDWHTGLGDYAQPFFLNFNAEGGAEQQEAIRWWGEKWIVGQRPNGLARPDYQGLVFNGVQQFLAGRPLVGAVVEFGTRPSTNGETVQLDQWLRFQSQASPDAHRDAQLQADLEDAFVPVSSIWRKAVVEHGVAITKQAVLGLQTWQ